MNILNLRDYGVRATLKDLGLTKYPKLGRGAFCAVYDKGDTVGKLTLDNHTYAFHSDAMSGIPRFTHNSYFPKVFEARGYIGEQSRIKGGPAESLSLHYIEVEKLRKLDRGSHNFRLAQRFCKGLYSFLTAFEREFHERHAGQIMEDSFKHYDTLEMYIESEQFLEYAPLEFQEALQGVKDFMADNGYTSLFDFHVGNFMERPSTGELVMSDVLCDPEVLRKFTQVRFTR